MKNKNVFNLLDDESKENQKIIDHKLIFNNYKQFKEFFGLSQDSHLYTDEGKIQERYFLGIFMQLNASNQLKLIDDEWYFTLTKNKQKYDVKILNVSLANINQIMKLEINKPQSFNFLFETSQGVNIFDCQFNASLASFLKLINFFLLAELTI